MRAIYNEKFKFVSIEIPKSYKKYYHDILKADPSVVDLKKMGPYYYDFGLLLVNLMNDEAGKAIGRILLWVNLVLNADSIYIVMIFYSMYFLFSAFDIDLGELWIWLVRRTIET